MASCPCMTPDELTTILCTKYGMMRYEVQAEAMLRSHVLQTATGHVLRGLAETPTYSPVFIRFNFIYGFLRYPELPVVQSLI